METKEKKTNLLKKYGLVIAAIVGALLMLLPRLMPEKEEAEEKSTPAEVVYYSEKLEEKIEQLICMSQGVGEAQVVVTLDKTGEYVFAQNGQSNEGGSSTDYVIVNGENGEECVLISEIYPKVRGVAVVCTGGNDAKVKARVTELIAAALGISSKKIAVSG